LSRKIQPRGPGGGLPERSCRPLRELIVFTGVLPGLLKCQANCRSSKAELSNAEIYTYKRELEKLHRDNRHIKDKICQQLQVLRDAGLLIHRSAASGGCHKFSDRMNRIKFCHSVNVVLTLHRRGGAWWPSAKTAAMQIGLCSNAALPFQFSVLGNDVERAV
jgi:Dam-replacing HTH domain